jgi:ribose 1,5-bisphosphokinase PhnN
MMNTESLPGLSGQTLPERLNRIEIPLGWVRSVEPLRPYAKNLVLLLGASGTGRDSLLDEMRMIDPSFQRIRRVTTRPNRNDAESDRIISTPRTEFMDSCRENTIVCQYNYPVNQQWYGIPIQELQKITNGPAFLEGTPELMALKTLLPESRLFVVVPGSLEQIQSQLTSRAREMDSETTRRYRQARRELTSLITRLPRLLAEKIVDGVIANTPPLLDSANRALDQIQKRSGTDSIPTQLMWDIQQYLSEWRQS